jgi:hypothetical protein
MEGGESMVFIISLIEIVIKAIVAALVKHAVSRTKEKIAPTRNRDDSKA